MSVRSAWGFAVLAALAALLLLAVSCGGDDDDDNGGTTAATSPPAASATPGSGPGTITLTSSAISGQSGKILLVFATAGGGGERVARLCQSISSDDYELPGVAMTQIPAQDPCGNDPDVVTFDEGTYQLTAGIYVGGQQTPVKTTTLTVEVAGNVTAELDGAELSD